MYRQIADCCSEIDGDADLHVAIIRGAGERAFCAGSDINVLDGYDDFWAWRNRTDYISWYCRDEGQLLAGRNWGQPSGLAAWNDPDIDSMAMGFYSCTRQTQADAYVRPLRSWWPAVQDEAGKTLAALLRSGAPASAIVDSLEAIYSRHRLSAAM